jgi:hypothetical protein
LRFDVPRCFAATGASGRATVTAWSTASSSGEILAIALNLT